MENNLRLTGDDDAIKLRDAAAHFGYTVDTLRAEARRGRLVIFKIGREYHTTPNDIRQMVSKCREGQKGRDFTLIRSDASGLSETDRASSALAAANETVQRLKSISRNTSATNTHQSRQGRR